MDRIIVLIDMDCFYVQVEQRARPELKGKPCAVVQYNTWKGGGIIAVGYEARAKGVTRQMRGNDAKAKCPDIVLVRVPEVRGKADLTRYREAGAEVIEVFSKFSNCVERASIDEAYIDLTNEVDKRLADMTNTRITEDLIPNTHIIGYEENSEDKDKAVLRKEGVMNWLQSLYDAEEMSEPDRRLTVGAMIVEEMRAAVFSETGFRCSAGIAHNKVLAKLACGVNKPNKQTLLSHGAVTTFFKSMPIRKVRGFGGKFGEAITEQLNVQFMADLQQFSLKKLQESFGDKSGLWVHDICRGLEYEPVSARQLPKSVGCSKNFRGPEKLDTQDKVKHWLWSLSKEVVERLEKDKEQNGRKAKSLVVGIRQDLGHDYFHSSRSCAIVKYDVQKFADDALLLLSKFNAAGHPTLWNPPVLNLSISATKFTDIAAEGNTSITNFMTQDRFTATQTQTSQYPKPSTSAVKDKQKQQGINCFFSAKSNKSGLSTEMTVNDEPEASTSVGIGVSREKNTNTNQSPKKSFFKSYMERKERKGFSSENYDKGINRVIIEDDEDSLNDFDVVRTKDLGCDNHVYDLDTDTEDSNYIKIISEEKPVPSPDNIVSNNPILEPSIQQSSFNATVNDPQHCDSSGSESNIKDSEDMMVCGECGKAVLVWEFPEHADFHFALNLQNEVQEEKRPLTLDNLDKPSAKRKNVTPPSSRSRKKTRLSGANMTTLDRFFK